MDQEDPMGRKMDPQAGLRADKVDKMDLQVDLQVDRSKVKDQVEQGQSLSPSSSIAFEGFRSHTRSMLRSNTHFVTL